MHSVNVSVLGGLPVTIEYSIEPADRDVGIQGGGIEEWSISHIAGRAVKKSPDWLYKRLDNSPKDIDRITDACADHFQSIRNDGPDCGYDDVLTDSRFSL